MIADDELHIVRLITRHLKKAGYSVVSTTDREKVLPLVRTEQPSLIILDTHQPPDRFFGCKIIEALREDVATGEIPVILLAAKTAEAIEPDIRIERVGSESVILWCKNLVDPTCYLMKPFLPRELVRRVNHALQSP